jgi:hypothetical protein
VGLSIVNSRAVFSALSGKKGEFKRTPKYNIGSQKRGAWYNKSYFSKADINCLVELIMMAYLAVTIYYSVKSGQFLAIPFILIYFFAFSYMACLSVIHSLRN